MTDMIRAAEAAQRRLARELNPRWHPGYHVVPPAGWLNDPNGLVWFAGQYHAFFQHHPFSSEWGPMHWGHAVSADLVHWRDAGVALAPDEPYDRDGCFSGSAVDNDGELTLVYTGHVYVDPDPRTRDIQEFTQNQDLALSRDGITFTKYAGNPVIAAPPEDSTHHFRDPKVWRHGDDWYMILGNAGRDGAGRAILYRSPDLRAWEYLGVVAQSDGSTGWMWECPDLFELDGRHVLLISPMGMGASTDDVNEYHTGSLIGSFDYQAYRLSHGPYVEMDHGHDFYAVQTLDTPDGRRVALGWMKAREDDASEKPDGWAGALSLPRELQVTGHDRLTMQPVAELEQLRVAAILDGSLVVRGAATTGASVGLAEVLISADLAASDAQHVGLRLMAGSQAVVDVVFDRAAGVLQLDRGGVDGVRRAALDAGDRLELRVYVDRSSIEVFTASGLVTMTSRIYPSGELTLHLVSTEGTTPFQVQVFALEDIWRTPGAGE